MKISGFTMCRNAEKLYYPIAESIASALPLVDEFVVALGQGDSDDRTLQAIEALKSPKVRIIPTTWDTDLYPQGMVHAHQTDMAKSHCSGDWLLYLQADEVLHEDGIAKLHKMCTDHLKDERVEGMLLKYRHFWGDYNHVVDAHGWYKREIRLIRNLPDIHSWQSGQSFRWIPNFDGLSYRFKEGTRKLRVLSTSAEVYHYGWVRPPEVMTRKMQELDRIHSHEKDRFSGAFDYGDLSKLNTFNGSHPEVMNARIAAIDWKEQLNQKSHRRKHKFKHERMHYKVLGAVERLLGGRELFGFQNYSEIT